MILSWSAHNEQWSDTYHSKWCMHSPWKQYILQTNLSVSLDTFSLNPIHSLNPLLFSLYLRHCFCSESEQLQGNRVKLKKFVWRPYTYFHKSRILLDTSSSKSEEPYYLYPGCPSEISLSASHHHQTWLGSENWHSTVDVTALA